MRLYLCSVMSQVMRSNGLHIPNREPGFFDGWRHAHHPDVSMSRGSTIYIVDDDPAVRAGLSLLVKACGWQPKPCASAEEFLDTYSRDESGCLVLDIQMPGVTGADLTAMMEHLGIRLPVIIVTAYKDHPLTERAKAAGALAVIPKPFRDEDLVSTIQRALADDPSLC